MQASKGAIFGASKGALLITSEGANNAINEGDTVDIGLVEKPFQHTCLKHLQDCVVNGD
jgi:hypothetical protein